MRYAELLARSEALPYEIPTRHNRLAELRAHADEIEEHAAGVRPILSAELAALTGLDEPALVRQLAAQPELVLDLNEGRLTCTDAVGLRGRIGARLGLTE